MKHNKITLLLITVSIMVIVLETPCLAQNPEVFALRRQKFMEKIIGGVAVFVSPEVANRNNDIDYLYRQNSDIYYLTGIAEPNCIIVLSPGSKYEYTLFLEVNPMSEMWTGKSLGVEDAIKKFGVDTAFAIEEFENTYYNYLYNKDILFYNLSDEKFNSKVTTIMKDSWRNFPLKIENPSPFIHSMRLIKSEEELELMQKAIDATTKAHIEALKFTEPGLYEYKVKALIEYVFAKNNCQRNAFPSIVASGPNANALHYENSSRKLQDGDLLLMDIGAEFDYYAADITRTIPVNGKFSPEQKELYEIVLKIQEAGIELVKEGTGIKKVEKTMTEMATKYLYDIGLVTNPESKWQTLLWYFPYTTHWLGLDVHDANGETEMNAYGAILKEGMVTTVEPGLYINPKNLENIKGLISWQRFTVSDEEINSYIAKVKTVVDKYANIGIRIEDDVLVTKKGNRVLSAGAPKSIQDIEEMMK